MTLKADFILRRPDGNAVQARFNLTLQPGSLAFLQGPPGSGKSAALQVIQGGLRPEAGRLIFENQIWYFGDGRTRLETLNRSVGLVRQEPAFNPEETVRQHISTVLAHWPTRSRGERLTDLLRKVGLHKVFRMSSSSLAPDQRWRLAIARALAPRPILLLLDEPFRWFPLETQKLMTQALREILQKDGIPALMTVTDAKALAEPDERVLSLEAAQIKRSAANRGLVRRHSAVA